MTNKHQLLFHFSSSLQGDINPHVAVLLGVLLALVDVAFHKYMVMASLSTNVRISSMENNQNVCTRRYREVSFWNYRLRKMVSK